MSTLKYCKKCVLNENYPNISFDENGVCNYCNEYSGENDKKPATNIISENELKRVLKKYKNNVNKYDVLVPVSGGVDSCNALITITEKMELNPLVFHNDHGYEPEEGTENVKKLCKELDVDLIIWQHDINFMKRYWKVIIECSKEKSNDLFRYCCPGCASIIASNAIEIAEKFNIKLIVTGYSKGQVENTKRTFKEMESKFEGAIEIAQNISGDNKFVDAFVAKIGKFYTVNYFKSQEDIVQTLESGTTLLIPFYIFDFYKTDKADLEKKCKDRFNWKQIKSYPVRSTNCKMNWLNTYFDLLNTNTTPYHEEYSSLIRAGEMTKEQAEVDLKFNPPEGMLEELAREIGIKL